MAGAVTVAQSGNSIVDGILYGTAWANTALTYSFSTLASDMADYGPASALDASYFHSLTSTEQTIFKSMLSAWSTVAAVTFTAAVTSANADIRIYWYTSPDNATARVVDFPSNMPEGGDVQLGGSVAPNLGPWDFGTYAALTLLHEIGHALGLKHPHDAIGDFPAVPAAEDSIASSVMSYRSYPGQNFGGYTIAPGSYPTGPMLNDIAALQYLYGANWSTNNGDTTYTFDPSASVIFDTIWDGGGTDTYNLTNYTTNLSINLSPGAWCNFGTQYADLGDSYFAGGNIANSYLYNGNTASLIENAIGGSGNDLMVGNQADNMLLGGTGNDTLSGGIGADTLDGGSGTDTLRYEGTLQQYSVVLLQDGSLQITDLRTGRPDGTDKALSIEWLDFAGTLLSVSDVLAAQPIQVENDLRGTPKGDVLVGGSNDNVLYGGLGRDTLSGGVGADAFVFDTRPNASTNLDRILDFSSRDDAIWLDNSVYTKLGKAGSPEAPAQLSKGFFTVGARAKDRNDYLIYDKGTGYLYYDADGSGRGISQVPIAVLKHKPSLAYKDFFVV